MKITSGIISGYRQYLEKEEKAEATVRKYIHDVTSFIRWLSGREADKERLLEYKEHLRGIYKPVSVNAAISALNSFFMYLGAAMRIKTIKIQKRIYSDSSRELRKQEYKRLLSAAEKNGDRRLYLIIKTIFATGIRVSELRFITAEAVSRGEAVISCKGKMRTVFISRDMCRILEKYISERRIKSGSIFITRTGKPVDRSNISKAMKKLAEAAQVVKSKVFPHNLRHLFARTYYSAYKDIVRLADILGHSSIDTTRIYTMESGDIHRRQIERLGLALC